MVTFTHSFVFTHKGTQEVRLCGKTSTGLAIIVDAKVKGTKVTSMRMHQQTTLSHPGMAKVAVPAEWVAPFTAACIKHQFGFVA